MHIILMGQEESKRTIFFQQAGVALKQEITFIPLNEAGIKEVRRLGELYPKQIAVKIDPLTYEDSEVSRLPEIIDSYQSLLNQLQGISNLSFLNEPKAILTTLNKIVCKQMLMEKGVNITPFYPVSIKNTKALRRFVKENKAYRLFIKVNYGSGAAGVVAYQCHPVKSQEIAFTSLKYENGKLYNTKTLRKLTDSRKIEEILDKLLEQQVIIEKWVPKAMYKGCAYDLRVIWQFGGIQKIIARQSAGPITNLHLNNRALDFEALHLDEVLIKQIETTCNEAMAVFPGLNMAGLDVLITSDQKQVKIIEMNGQGDLAYKDIYGDNLIYKKQIERMIQNA